MKPRVPNPYEPEFHYTERTANQRFVEWINKIVGEENLGLGVALQETSLANRKSPDIIITKSPGSKKPLCLIELKLPSFDVLNETELIEPASEKAFKIRSPYFATCNINRLVLFSTEKSRQLAPLTEQIIDRYTLTKISDPDSIDQPGIRLNIQKNLKRFLTDLVETAKGERPRPKRPIDDLLIYRLHSAIQALQIHYKELLKKKIIDEPKFNKKLGKWFVEQGWSYLQQDDDFDKAARQAAYLLINKILFYTALQEKLGLTPLSIPKDMTDSGILKDILQAYFNRVLKIDYQTVFTTDFIDELAFPHNVDAVLTLTDLIKDIKGFRISELGYDVIGKIFERLIPLDERHKLGQYFTRSDVIDLILKFCLKSEEDVVFDPSCGTGTFLVRAYQHKKLANPRLSHEKILETLWGGDIAKFPAHLATINLAVKDLSSDKNFPGIFQKDFFDIRPDLVDFIQPRRVIVKGLDEPIEMELPRRFECVIGNPPYTRQEEMEDIVGSEGYKGQITETVTHYQNKKIAELGKRAGIYAHFFMHGWKFLHEGGRFGFIVSNSWLDVDYGKYLQEFFLKHFEIVAVIGSKVERWFEDADINTCIVILEKCKDTKQRNENLVRFVQLKKPLAHFIPSADDGWEKEIKRLEEVDKLKKLILGHSECWGNKEIKIYPKKQKELWREGFDSKTQKYEGAKWGKYIRAPEIFFEILKKAGDKLVPLKEVADVRRGFTTGANEFFYLTEDEIKKWRIEKEFWTHKNKEGKRIPNYVIRSGRESKSITVVSKDLKSRVLMIHKDKKSLKGTNALKYIQWGEQQGFNRRPTCLSRGEWWYDLGERPMADMFYFYQMGDRFLILLNKSRVYADCNLFDVHAKGYPPKLIAGILNSTVTRLFLEMQGRQLTGALTVLKIQVYELLNTLVPSPGVITESVSKRLISVFEKLSKREIPSLFSELGAQKPDMVSLDKINSDRRDLDKIVMGEFLGLTDEEQLEVYRAVVDLVGSRLEKAKSVEKKSKSKSGINVDAYVQTVLKAIGEETLGKFYQDKIASKKTGKVELSDFKGTPKVRQDILGGWVVYSGREKLLVDSEDKAEYLKIFAQAGLRSIGVPKNEKYLSKILPKLKELMGKNESVVNEYLSSIIDKKLRRQLSTKIWAEICKGAM